MRTVTFLGFLIIGGALRNLADMPKLGEYSKFLAIILAIAMVMDVADFLKNITK